VSSISVSSIASVGSASGQGRLDYSEAEPGSFSTTPRTGNWRDRPCRSRCLTRRQRTAERTRLTDTSRLEDFAGTGQEAEQTLSDLRVWKPLDRRLDHVNEAGAGRFQGLATLGMTCSVCRDHQLNDGCCSHPPQSRTSLRAGHSRTRLQLVLSTFRAHQPLSPASGVYKYEWLHRRRSCPDNGFVLSPGGHGPLSPLAYGLVP
jgi:hypothetical protein